jgi:carboxypeptidase PM20D1
MRGVREAGDGAITRVKPARSGLRRGCGAIAAALALLVALLVANTFRLPAPPPPGPATAAVPVDLEAATARLARALRFRTVTYDDPARAHPEELAALRAFLAASFPRVHAAMSPKLVGGGSLLYTWRGRHPQLPPVLLMAHQDVVPVEDERAWTHPPFGGVVADGYVWGRGAIDDKGSLLGLLEACEALLVEGFTPDRTVYLELGHDEEGGGAGAAQVAALLRSRRVRLAMVLDEGGFYARDLMPGLAVPAALVGIAEKGYLSLELVATGEAGHSSRPPKRTAIGVLSRALARLEANPFPPRVDGATRQMLRAFAPRLPFARRVALANLWLLGPVVARGLTDDPSSAALVRTTTALTVISAGGKDNVLPSRARAVVNFRILPGETVAGTMAHVRRVLADDTIAVRPLAAGGPMGGAAVAREIEPPPVSRVGSPGWTLVRDVARQSWPGDVVVAPYLLTGASDSRWFAPIADDVYRFTGFTIGPEDVSRFHGVDERIAVADYERVIAVYYRLLRALARPL